MSPERKPTYKTKKSCNSAMKTSSSCILEPPGGSSCNSTAREKPAASLLRMLPWPPPSRWTGIRNKIGGLTHKPLLNFMTSSDYPLVFETPPQNPHNTQALLKAFQAAREDSTPTLCSLRKTRRALSPPRSGALAPLPPPPKGSKDPASPKALHKEEYGISLWVSRSW